MNESPESLLKANTGKFKLLILAFSAVVLWFCGYWSACPTYGEVYLQRYSQIAIVTIVIVVPALVAWWWLMRGTRPPVDSARRVGVVRAYIDAWRRMCDYKSNHVHPRFRALILVFELTLVLNIAPWIILMDIFRHLLGTSEAAMYLPAFLCVSLDVLPLPAMLARRLRFAGRSVWWTIPALVVLHLFSYLVMAWVLGYAWATSGK